MLTIAAALTPGARTSKHIHADGTIEPYSAGTWFHFCPRPIDSFTMLMDVLYAVEMWRAEPLFVVPGTLQDEHQPTGRRLSAPKHGSSRILADTPTPVLCFDFDKLVLPGAPPWKDPQAAAKTLLAVKDFPPDDYIVQWSASTGIGDKIGAHVWCLSNRALSARQRRQVYLRRGADPSVAQPGSPIYVQPPTFADPGMDPFHGALRTYIVSGACVRP